ncbi:MAG: quinoprotein relay system zinc metallohydrolase 2 [Alphaproteobacteria bacterium]|nr:quinoprotein relay system zinc metallohydrolase 2 [Alphaproteobacteria bacterium]
MPIPPRFWPGSEVRLEPRTACRVAAHLFFSSIIRWRLGLAIALAAAFGAAGRTDILELPVTEVVSGIFVHNGVHEEASAANEDGIANIGFIIGNDAVAVIDPGGSFAEGRALRAAVRARTDRPIRYVILTHIHPDHILGAAAFRGDHPEFVGHDKLPGALNQRGDYYLRRLRDALGDEANGSEVVLPTRLVADRLELDLGGRRLSVQAYRPAHTDNDLTVYDHETRTFWLGDLLFVDRIPVIDGSLVGWLDQLNELTATPAERAIPGHGPVSVPWPAGAAPERRYLEAVVHDTRKAIKSGIGIANAYRQVANSERGNWLLFDEYHPRNVTAAYKELEWE